MLVTNFNNKLTLTNNIGVYTKDDLSQIYLKLIELEMVWIILLMHVNIIMNST